MTASRRPLLPFIAALMFSVTALFSAQTIAAPINLAPDHPLEWKDYLG